MKKLILHVGTHKTGTTSLQRFFQENASAMLEQGVCVPDIPMEYSTICQDRNGYFLMRAVRGDIRPNSGGKRQRRYVERSKDIVRTLMEQHDTFLLSDERIWYEGAIDDRFWPRLKEILDDLGFDEVLLVLYLRRQDQLIESLWNEYVKVGSRLYETLPEYIALETSQRMMDYDRGLAQMEQVFGKERIVVRLFDREAFTDGDIYHDFFAAVGFEWSDSLALPQNLLNPRLSKNVAEIKRISNESALYRSLDNFLYRPAVTTSGAYKEPKTSLIGLSQVEELHARFGPGNAAVSQRHFGLDGELFEWPGSVAEQWKPENPDMLRDVIRYFTEAMAVEHAVSKRKRREQDQAIERLQKTVQEQYKVIDKLSKRIERMEAVNRNSAFLKVERKIRGRDTLEGTKH